MNALNYFTRHLMRAVRPKPARSKPNIKDVFAQSDFKTVQKAIAETGKKLLGHEENAKKEILMQRVSYIASRCAALKRKGRSAARLKAIEARLGALKARL